MAFFRLFSFFGIAFLMSLAPALASDSAMGPGPTCLDIFKRRLPAVVKVQELPLAIEQLFLWEQTANHARFLMPTIPYPMDVSLVPASRIQTRTIPGTENLTDFYVNQGLVAWPQHPFNTQERVPFFSLPAQFSYPVYFSASRSLFFWNQNHLLSVKMPTNHPHPNQFEQPTKWDLTKSVIASVERSQAIREFDRNFGESPYLRVLYDVASFADKVSGNGFVVRDLSPLQDGHYYLPGFSIPYVGLDLARRQLPRADLESYWGLHYAEAVGRAKALLLLRYGLQMRTPNSQNWLVQLDRDMIPTGRIFMRDVSDASLVSPIAHELGYGRAVRRDLENDLPIHELIRPETETTFFLMEDGGIFTDMQTRWGQLHDRAYVTTITREMQLPADIQLKTVYDVQAFFSTDRGRAHLRSYARRRQPVNGDLPH